MARGDQIYVMRPFFGVQALYEHHGIDCGDGTVIHYRKPETEEATISQTSMAEFSRGDRIYLKRYTTSIMPEDVVNRATSRLGEQQYDLLSNNCEHFATWCKTGVSDSAQLRQFGVNLNGWSAADVQRLITQPSRSQPDEYLALVQQALQNIAIARAPIQSRYQTLTKEAKLWQRVARLAVGQAKDYLARRALTRKLDYQKQAQDLEAQLRQLDDLEAGLQANLQQLQRSPDLW